MTAGSSRRRLLLAGLLALVAAWIAAPAAVPLYDGVGFPDEPYRYVSRPAGDVVKTTPPTTVSIRIPLVGGSTDSSGGASAEQGPQITLFSPAGAFVPSKGAHTILLRAVPAAPDGSVDGEPIDGNICHLTATADVTTGAPVSVRGKIQVTMRATTARQPAPTMVYRKPGETSWIRLQTSKQGNDIYSAVGGLGDYALVFASPARGSDAARRQRASSHSKRILGLALAAVGISVLASTVVAVRVGRSRRLR